ncbi:hypothetical protein PT286_03115 [Neisseriaceae bacterium ESL0693]|nr:hypothetical protein [Neisseriaceae bacterium ESL0693]
MFHIRVLVLLGCFMLAACKNTVGFEPKNYYLPEATVGKPYRQVIHLYPSGPLRHVSVGTWPEEAGLDWQYSRTDSKYWRENREVKGNAIEITGIPADNPQKEIKIGVWGHTMGTMWPGTESYKEYMIKLAPDKAKSIAKP